MALWLTRLTPSLTSRLAQKELGAAHGTSLHRRVMSLFPDGVQGPARTHYGVLFRIEDTARGSYLLLQSNQPPDPAGLPDNYGTLTTRPLDDLLAALKSGRTIHFRCAASPVRKPGATTRALYNLPPVVPLRGNAADEWWQRQAEAAGMKTLTLTSQPLDAVCDRPSPNHPAKSGNTIRHHRVRFDGTATVIDPDLLRSALTSGIGRGKAYGCGLLSVAPAPDLV